MDVAIIKSNRLFQLWSYSVSHRELLFRSIKSGVCATRIDVFFKGVKEIHLPTTSDGLSVTEASEADLRQISALRESAFEKNIKVFMVEGANFVGYVAALIALAQEDEGEYDEPSFFAPK